MRKSRSSTTSSSGRILATTAGRILGRSAASVRLYAHAGRLDALITEEGVHIFERSQVEALRRTLDGEQQDGGRADA
jgi:hypothetical protein